MISVHPGSATSRVIRRLGRLLQPLATRTEGGLVVLAYHLVEAGTASPVDVSSRCFRHQLESLTSRMPAVELNEAVRRVASGQDGALTALTFDDAFANFAEEALPLLEEFDTPAVLYVPTDFVDGHGTSPLRGAEGLQPCSWDLLRDLARHPLVQIGSHTCGHPDLTAIPHAEAVREIRESRLRIEDQLGIAVTSFCYPRGLWSRRLGQEVAVSYETGVVGGGYRNLAGRLQWERLSRCPVRCDTPSDLGPILDRSVWVEECFADLFRRYRP